MSLRPEKISLVSFHRKSKEESQRLDKTLDNVQSRRTSDICQCAHVSSQPQYFQSHLMSDQCLTLTVFNHTDSVSNNIRRHHWKGCCRGQDLRKTKVLAKDPGSEVLTDL